jgi:flagellar hook assembly protein FlgD
LDRLISQVVLDRSVNADIVSVGNRGQVVKELVNETKNSGSYRYVWDGKDSFGRSCSSGIFYLKMSAGGKEYNKKAILLK